MEQKQKYENLKHFLKSYNESQTCLNLHFRKYKANQISKRDILELTSVLLNFKDLTTLILNLENQHLLNEKDLFKDLENLPKIQSLKFKLYGNIIGNFGITNLSHAFANNVVQELYLDLKYNNIKTKGIEALCNALEKCQNLQKLFLNLSYNKVQKNDTLNLGFALSKCLKLQKLKLNFIACSIRAQGVLDLCSRLENCQDLKYFGLKLWHNNIRNESLLNLGICLKKYSNLSYLSLDFQFNNIDDLGVSSFYSTISDYQNISILYLNFANNIITKKGVSLLISMMSQITKFQSLTIQLNDNIFLEGDFQMINQLSVNNKNTLALKLKINGHRYIPIIDAMHLVFLLSYCQNISSLDLGLGYESEKDQRVTNELKRKILKMKRLVNKSVRLCGQYL